MTISVLSNRILDTDKPIHNWYRFILSYPPHLVREIFELLNIDYEDHILDPFCGTGTTLVESRLNGISATGYESNPILGMVNIAKLNWNIDTNTLEDYTNLILLGCRNFERSNPNTYKTLNSNQMKLLIKDSIHPKMLHQCLLLKNEINNLTNGTIYQFLLNTALAKLIHNFASNIMFKPSPTVRIIDDESIKNRCCYDAFNAIVNVMIDDCLLNDDRGSGRQSAVIHDARLPRETGNYDAIVSSPPYPTEHDYTRFTRLESVILGYSRNAESLQVTKKSMISSHSKGIYSGCSDSNYVYGNQSIENIMNQIVEARNDKAKTQTVSNFEMKYDRVVSEYFGGMTRNLISMLPNLRRGGKIAYVLGDQNSYYNINIKTAELLGVISESLGYNKIEIKKFRSRAATATNVPVPENILVLEKK